MAQTVAIAIQINNIRSVVLIRMVGVKEKIQLHQTNWIKDKVYCGLLLATVQYLKKIVRALHESKQTKIDFDT